MMGNIKQLTTENGSTEAERSNNQFSEMEPIVVNVRSDIKKLTMQMTSRASTCPPMLVEHYSVDDNCHL